MHQNPLLISAQTVKAVENYCRQLGLCYKLPLASCSLSIASNKALKLPLPKLFAPLRCMISKNIVGRS